MRFCTRSESSSLTCSSRAEAENLFLRHQLSVALRRSPPRLRLRDSDERCWCGWCGSGLTWLDWPRWSSLRPCCAGIGGLHSLLTLEVEEEGRAAENRSRVARAESTDEHQRTSALGRLSVHGERLMLGFSVDSLKVHDTRPQAAVADLEDISAQSCRCNCRERYMCCADGEL